MIQITFLRLKRSLVEINANQWSDDDAVILAYYKYCSYNKIVSDIYTLCARAQIQHIQHRCTDIWIVVSLEW